MISENEMNDLFGFEIPEATTNHSDPEPAPIPSAGVRTDLDETDIIVDGQRVGIVKHARYVNRYGVTKESFRPILIDAQTGKRWPMGAANDRETALQIVRRIVDERGGLRAVFAWRENAAVKGTRKRKSVGRISREQLLINAAIEKVRVELHRGLGEMLQQKIQAVVEEVARANEPRLSELKGYARCFKDLKDYLPQSLK